MRLLKGFARFWYDFIIGDDWKIAVAVVLALAATLAVALSGLLSLTATAVLGGILLLTCFVVSVLVDTRR